MTTLTANQSAVFTVATGNNLVISQGGEGNIIANGVTKSFTTSGATYNWDKNVTVDLNITSGSVNYSVVPSNINANFSYSSNGNVIGLNNGSNFPIYINSFAIYANYKATLAKINKVRNGTANMKVLFSGDSTTLGRGSVTAGTSDGAQPKSPTQHFANIMTALGLKSTSNNFCGDGNTGSVANFALYDTRFTNSGAALWFGAQAPGGNAFRLNAAGNSVTFTLSSNVDRWDIYYYDGSGTFSWTGSGGGTGNIVMAGSNVIKKATVTVTAGTALTLANVSGTIYMQGVAGYLNAATEVQVFNGGVSSNKTADALTAVTSVNQAYQGFLFDLVVLDYGINDMQNAVSVDTYKSNLQSLITYHKSFGSDVMLATFNPIAISLVTLDTQKQYIKAIYDLAATNNLVVLDTFNMMTSYEIAQPLGLFSDTIHLTGAGYASKAKLVSNVTTLI